MQGMFAAQAPASEGPASAITRFNKALCRRGIEARFVTLLFGVLTAEGKLTYCNAGHNPPMVLGKAGVRRLEAGGPVVGLLEAAPYAQATEQLDPGDVIVLFSDGVSEAFNVAGEDLARDVCWTSRARIRRFVAGAGGSDRRSGACVHEGRSAERRHHRDGDPLPGRCRLT